MIDLSEVLYDCPQNTTTHNHDWMPIAFRNTERSKNVTEVMCKNCYLNATLAEVFRAVSEKGATDQ